MSESVEQFLSAQEEQEIVAAIREAERMTSGEIRVHLEEHCQGDLMVRTKEVFHWLKMDQTKEENGVLIYVATADHKFAIYGDQGIHEKVTDTFWNTTKDKIQTQFRQGNFKQGLVEGVLSAGKELQHYFPWDHTDTNELSDDISKS